MVIILRYWQDFSEEEISKTLSMSIPAVKSRLHRARKQLALLIMQSQPLLVERSTHESPAF